MSNDIIHAAQWVGEDRIICPNCRATQYVNVATRFSEAYKQHFESHKREVDRLLKIIEEYEEKDKCVGRYILMNGGDVICHSDSHKVIYEYIIECIKNDATPSELMVIDQDGVKREFTFTQFLWTWGY